MRARAVGRLKALAEAGTKSAGIGGTADLQRLTPNIAAVPATDVNVAVHTFNRMLELGRPESVRIA